MPAERTPRFPNPGQAPRLVLYPIAGGGVALDWRLDPALVEQAGNAFAVHQPFAKLYLRRADADGAGLAETALTDLVNHLEGQARFQGPLVGALQAEIGLEWQQGGGWLLLARSNRLELAPEREPQAPLSNLSLQTEQPAPVPLGAAPAASMSPRLEDAAPDTQLPIKYPVLGQSTSAAAVAGELTPSSIPRELARSFPAQPLDAAQVSASETTQAQGRVRGSKLSGTTRFPDPSLTALAIWPELRGTAFPLPLVPLLVSDNAQHASGPRLNPTADQQDSASARGRVPEQSPEQPAKQHGSGDQADADQVLLDQQPPNRQDVAPSERLATKPALSGSGPLVPYPTGDGAVIQGELHVFGSAAPGSLLDLGGHPYQVGPGGRFSFRVALDDPELLAALLRRLPGLPVAERDP